MNSIKDGLLDNFSPETKDFKQLDFPLSFEFKIGTLSNDFIARDAKGNLLSYVRQKLFLLKDDVVLFSDESRQNEIYRIRADRWIDFNSNYAFSRSSDEYMGSIGRKGMKSLWKATYIISDPDKKEEYTITEENPWAKVGDTLLGEVPIVSMLTGYLFNPKYLVKDLNGNPVARISKEASFFGRKFKVDSLTEIPREDGERIMLALMMMVLLERRRG